MSPLIILLSILLAVDGIASKNGFSHCDKFLKKKPGPAVGQRRKINYGQQKKSYYDAGEKDETKKKNEENCEQTEEYIKCIRQQDEAERVRKIYEMTKLVVPGLFALTEDAAENLPGLLPKYTVPKIPRCNKTLPEFASCKARELSQIAKSLDMTCKNENKKGRRKKRFRRMTSNSDGSSTLQLSCVKKGDTVVKSETDLHASDLCYLCSQCNILTTLPSTRFPRYINEVHCDRTTRPECVSGEGVCSQVFTQVIFRRDTKGVGLGRLGEWEEYQQRINTACRCNCQQKSFLRDLML